jgi:hypothetical protein
LHLSYCCKFVAISLVIGHAARPSLIVLLLLIEISLSDISSAVRRPLSDYRFASLHLKPIDLASLTKVLLLLEFTEVRRLVGHSHVGRGIAVLFGLL